MGNKKKRKTVTIKKQTFKIASKMIRSRKSNRPQKRQGN